MPTDSSLMASCWSLLALLAAVKLVFCLRASYHSSLLLSIALLRSSVSWTIDCAITKVLPHGRSELNLVCE